MNKFIKFAAPQIGEDEIEEVARTMRSGWLTTGTKTNEFETLFGGWLGQDVHTVAVNSATAGLHLAIEALGIGPGDEVITTTHTFTATAEVIRYMGADPVLVDIDPVSMCISIDCVRRAITPRTKAVIVVHFGGLAADMDSLLTLAREFNLLVIEDAAHALPTTYKQKMIGTLESDATVFSFYANKTMTTGEGGMLVSRRQDVIDRARTMRSHGINRDAFRRFISEEPAWRYDVVAPGFKYNMTDIAASIGVHQLRKAHGFRERRSEIASLYSHYFAETPLILPARALDGDLHAWHLYVIRLPETLSIDRDQFIDEMFKCGIGCSVHYIPLHEFSYWKRSLKISSSLFPKSHDAYLRSVSLPIYPGLDEEEIAWIISNVRRLICK